MVQVQSCGFPRFDCSLQTLCDIRTAGEEAFRKATHRFYRTRKDPSAITFRVAAA